MVQSKRASRHPQRNSLAPRRRNHCNHYITKHIPSSAPAAAPPDVFLHAPLPSVRFAAVLKPHLPHVSLSVLPLNSPVPSASSSHSSTLLFFPLLPSLLSCASPLFSDSFHHLLFLIAQPWCPEAGEHMGKVVSGKQARPEIYGLSRKLHWQFWSPQVTHSIP